MARTGLRIIALSCTCGGHSCGGKPVLEEPKAGSRGQRHAPRDRSPRCCGPSIPRHSGGRVGSLRAPFGAVLRTARGAALNRWVRCAPAADDARDGRGRPAGAWPASGNAFTGLCGSLQWCAGRQPANGEMLGPGDGGRGGALGRTPGRRHTPRGAGWDRCLRAAGS